MRRRAVARPGGRLRAVRRVTWPLNDVGTLIEWRIRRAVNHSLGMAFKPHYQQRLAANQTFVWIRKSRQWRHTSQRMRKFKSARLQKGDSLIFPRKKQTTQWFNLTERRIRSYSDWTYDCAGETWLPKATPSPDEEGVTNYFYSAEQHHAYFYSAVRAASRLFHAFAILASLYGH